MNMELRAPMMCATACAIVLVAACTRTPDDALHRPVDVNYAAPGDPFHPAERRGMFEEAQQERIEEVLDHEQRTTPEARRPPPPDEDGADR